MNVILFNERGKIAWTPLIRTGGGNVAVRREFWVTKAGLILPVGQTATNLRRVINAQSTEVDVPGDDLWHHAGAILSPDGQLMVCDARGEAAHSHPGCRYYIMQCYLPYCVDGGEGTMLNHCISNTTLGQLATGALEVAKGDLYKALGILERAAIGQIKRVNYRIETAQRLLDWTREEMVRQYGAAVLEEPYPWHKIGAVPR